MKKCSGCKETKKLKHFSNDKSRFDGLSNSCKDCCIMRSRKHYHLNKEKIIRQKNLKHKERHTKSRQKMLDYLKTHHCVDCGFDNPMALEFDHVRGQKKMNVSELLGGGYRWETILEEIDKCDVRCANCHSIKTAKERNWYTSRL